MKRIQEVIIMSILCHKVRNSLSVTIPNEITKRLGIKAGDEINVTEKNGTIILVPIKKRLRDESFLEEYYGKLINEIEMIDSEEIDWGEPKGKEIW